MNLKVELMGSGKERNNEKFRINSKQSERYKRRHYVEHDIVFMKEKSLMNSFFREFETMKVFRHKITIISLATRDEGALRTCFIVLLLILGFLS